MGSPRTPFVPAKAGIQGHTLLLLGPRFRGDERELKET